MNRVAFVFLFSFFAATAVGQITPRAVVINEILFNPKPGGADYVELYNRSDSPVDLRHLFLANRNSSGQYGLLKKLSNAVSYV